VPIDLSLLDDPSRVAVVISEMQRGIVGDLARPPMVAMRDALVEHGTIGALARLVAGARAADVAVVHATLQYRRDRLGLTVNTPLMAVMTADPEYLVAGTPDAEVIPELAPEPRDLVAARYHGLSAFTGTELDAFLRAMGVETLVLGGVSLNEAVIGTAIEAANLGYRVVIPSDAVMGLPYDYGQDVLQYAMRLLGPVVPVETILAIWARKPCATSDRSDNVSMNSPAQSA